MRVLNNEDDGSTMFPSESNRDLFQLRQSTFNIEDWTSFSWISPLEQSSERILDFDSISGSVIKEREERRRIRHTSEYSKSRAFPSRNRTTSASSCASNMAIPSAELFTIASVTIDVFPVPFGPRRRRSTKGDQASQPLLVDQESRSIQETHILPLFHHS